MTQQQPPCKSVFRSDCATGVSSGMGGSEGSLDALDRADIVLKVSWSLHCSSNSAKECGDAGGLLHNRILGTPALGCRFSRRTISTGTCCRHSEIVIPSGELGGTPSVGLFPNLSPGSLASIIKGKNTSSTGLYMTPRNKKYDMEQNRYRNVDVSVKCNM